ncbi:hypothetical protein [Priestia megaterium]|uniref:hypothetical protein n=1 Tax=Priestia megaterium TaxID=1404 RepID=UPI00211CA9FB|nr:hypothetical protein [Priestia megaterium]
MDIFEKLVDFLGTVNDMNKRGLAPKVATEDLLASLTTEAINHYNKNHAMPQQQPQQQMQQAPQQQMQMQRQPQAPRPFRQEEKGTNQAQPKQEVIEMPINHQGGNNPNEF